MRHKKQARSMEEKRQAAECRQLARTKNVTLLQAIQDRLQDSIRYGVLTDQIEYVKYCQHRLWIVDRQLQKYAVAVTVLVMLLLVSCTPLY